MSFEASLYYQELLFLSKSEAIDRGDLELSFRLMTESLARSLSVARASIWLYNEDHSAIVCKDLYERNSDSHSHGLLLNEKDFPTYFKFLREERTIPAHDAFSDPATSEFLEVYLRPLNIHSLLDAPIRVNGKMIGVICCEQLSVARTWTVFEESFVGNISDILARAFQARDRANAQQELKKVNANLEDIVRQRTSELKEVLARSAESAKLVSLGQMAGGIAHEVNTPLNSIIFSAECARDLITSEKITSIDLAEQINLIEETSMRIAKIIQGLKWFAQDEKKCDFELFDLGMIVDQALELCQQRFRSGNVDVKWERPRTESLVICQPVQIGQVVLNLLTNAYDAASEQGSGWIEVKIVEAESTLNIEVSNSGTKVCDEVFAKLFEPFFTTKSPGKGTGLGLPLSKGIIKNHDGDLRLDRSRANTCFIVTLSRARSNAVANDKAS